MIIWKQNVLPIGKFNAIFLFGVLFVKKDVKLLKRLINHEKIHSRQYIEITLLSLILLLPLIFILWWLPLLSLIMFYIIYIIEWLIKLPFGNSYYKISFEREAYNNEYNLEYLKTRKIFSWIKYIK